MLAFRFLHGVEGLGFRGFVVEGLIRGVGF